MQFLGSLYNICRTGLLSIITAVFVLFEILCCFSIIFAYACFLLNWPDGNIHLKTEYMYMFTFPTADFFALLYNAADTGILSLKSVHIQKYSHYLVILAKGVLCVKTYCTTCRSVQNLTQDLTLAPGMLCHQPRLPTSPLRHTGSNFRCSI
jgi:hypothetical protein